LSFQPRVPIVDITHDIRAHDVVGAAFILFHAAINFPPGTLHVAVVDPGVGTERRILAARFGEQHFLFPDNGIISFVAHHLPLREIAVVHNPRYMPHTPASMTFHGRDVFMPVAAHMLGGVQIHMLGTLPETYKTFDIPEPKATDDTIVGSVLHVDHFGNLISNITERMVRERWQHIDRLIVTCDSAPIGKLVNTYGHVAEGEPLALFNSMRLIEVAVNGGSAEKTFNAKVGTEVRIFETQ